MLVRWASLERAESAGVASCVSEGEEAKRLVRSPAPAEGREEVFNVSIPLLPKGLAWDSDFFSGVFSPGFSELGGSNAILRLNLIAYGSNGIFSSALNLCFRMIEHGQERPKRRITTNFR